MRGAGAGPRLTPPRARPGSAPRTPRSGGAGEGPASGEPPRDLARTPPLSRVQGKLFPSWSFGFIGMRRFSDNTQGRWREGAGVATWRGGTRRPRAELSVARPLGPAAALRRPRLRTSSPARKGWLRGPVGRRGAGLGREAARCSSAAVPPGLARRKLRGCAARRRSQEKRLCPQPGSGCGWEARGH